MKAAIIESYGESSELKVVGNLTVPTIKDDEVLVRNRAISVNPIDYKARQGLLESWYAWEFPVVLGWDLAGEIVQVGNQVTTFQVGDLVFARPDNDPTGKNGAYAEYTAVKQDKLALKPKNISFEQAAAVPLAGLTALQMLRQLKLKAGERILIQAGAGGVGIFAIQLAKLMGAEVITTASQKNHDLVRQLGADIVIDYHQQSLTEVVHDIDAVLDSVGQVDEGMQVLKDEGRLVTISAQVTSEQQSTNKDVMAGWLQPNGADLTELAHYIENEQLEIIIDQILPFTTDGFRAAHQRLESHHARGKVVLKVI